MAFLSNILAVILAATLQFNALSLDATGINIETVCQDESGNMWFGGMDGITRYDGTRFTVFRNDTNNPGSIQDNRIYKFLCSTRGQMWVAHISGLSVFDATDESFRNFRSPGGPVKDIVQISDAVFLVIAGSTLWLFNSDGEVFTRDGLPEPLVDFPAQCLCENGGMVFIGGSEGRLAITSTGLDHAEEFPTRLGDERINAVLRDSPSHIWVGTEENGLWSASLSDGSTLQYRSSQRRGSLCSDNVRSLCLGVDGKLWVGTKNGLNIFDGKNFDTYHHDYYESRSITHDSIHDIFRDNQGSMWLGSYFGGVCYYTAHSSHFSSTISTPDDNNLNGNVISDITEDLDGSLWIGTNSGGLNHLLKDGGYEHIRGLDGNDSDVPDIKCIWLSPMTGRIFVGSDAARLSTLDRKNKRLKVLGPDAPKDCYALEGNRNGGVFLGTSSGLYEYDEESGKFSKILIAGDITNIKSLEYGSDGTLWIGKKFGVTAIDWNSGKVLELPDALSGVHYVEDILEDTSGRIWTCSNAGLSRYDSTTGAVTTFTSGDGLPDNVIHGIEEDGSGHFWISTNNGLCRLDPETGDVWTFTVADGLPGDRFTAYAHAITSEGNMYFGGLVGLVRFRPESVTRPLDPVSPVISAVEMNGRIVHPESDTVVLSPNERDISIIFSAPDYISGRNGRFFYRMEGMEENWHTAGMERKAVYHGLEHGHYTFLLDYSNSSGLRNIDHIRLHIVVKARWWETLAAKATFAGIIILLIILIMLWLISKKENEYKSEMEKARNELLRDFSLEFVSIGYDKTSPEKTSVTDVFDQGDEAFMRKSMKLVKDNLDNPNFTVEDFAEGMNVSKSSLHTRVKSLFGVSPLKFIKTVRFNEACRLILEKEHSFAEIAYMVGFASPSYFASAFHNFIGCTPTEYLVKMKNARRDNPTGGDI